jgi:integrase
VSAFKSQKYLNTSELNQLTCLLERDTSRNATLLLVLLHSGARASEILNLTGADVNGGAIFIRGLKGSYDREIPLPDWLYNRVTALVRDQAGNVFNISYKRLYQIWCDYRPAKKKLHSLRHTCAINLYRRTKDLRLVKAVLGHKNILNTMIYAEYVYMQDELRKLLIA